ncbi:MAG: GNAT family N-acetyltransferase [Vicinamibacterales bacterium]
MAIRPMLVVDVEQVVRIHRASFPGFFLTELGPAFLRRFYRLLLESSVGVGVVAEQSGVLVGFAAGATRQEGLFRELLRRGVAGFAFDAFVYALRNPSATPRLLRALRRPRESRESAAPAALMSLAVAPEAQAGGTGLALVEAFCRGIASRGASKVCLTTDADGNDRVNRFYARAGFVLIRTFVTPEGRRMNEYAKCLDPAVAVAGRAWERAGCS